MPSPPAPASTGACAASGCRLAPPPPARYLATMRPLVGIDLGTSSSPIEAVTTLTHLERPPET